jgi:hypothetical protein
MLLVHWKIGRLVWVAKGRSPVVHQQGFDTTVVPAGLSKEEERKKLVECGATDASAADVESTNDLIKADKDWKWFDGNLGEYYNKLEQDEHAKHKPDVITSYAVHRWMGLECSTLEHYKIIRSAVYESVLGELPSQSAGASTTSIWVLDAGCGLGAGLMWFEQNVPSWKMVGHTISEEHFKWITQDLSAIHGQIGHL